jgi:hypothetical protein
MLLSSDSCSAILASAASRLEHAHAIERSDLGLVFGRSILPLANKPANFPPHEVGPREIENRNTERYQRHRARLCEQARQPPNGTASADHRKTNYRGLPLVSDVSQGKVNHLGPFVRFQRVESPNVVHERHPWGAGVLCCNVLAPPLLEQLVGDGFSLLGRQQGSSAR